MTNTQYESGDKVMDLTFDPAVPGTIVAKHETRPDAYLVETQHGIRTISARNLQHVA